MKQARFDKRKKIEKKKNRMKRNKINRADFLFACICIAIVWHLHQLE